MARRPKLQYTTKTRDPLFRKWQNIRFRITNSNHSQYEYYKDLDCIGLDNFWEFRDWIVSEIGYAPTPNHMLARRDHSRGFVPGNMQWVDSRVPIGAAAVKAILITYRRRTQCASQWAREMGIHHDTITQRIQRGWPAKLAITTPASYANRYNGK